MFGCKWSIQQRLRSLQAKVGHDSPFVTNFVREFSIKRILLTHHRPQNLDLSPVHNIVERFRVLVVKILLCKIHCVSIRGTWNSIYFIYIYRHMLAIKRKDDVTQILVVRFRKVLTFLEIVFITVANSKGPQSKV